MDIWVGGCVSSPGWIEVPRFTKLRQVIHRAGGFKYCGLLRPSGVITVRSRKKPTIGRIRSVRKQVNFYNTPSILDSIWLLPGDAVIVQFDNRGLRWAFNRNLTCGKTLTRA